MYRKMHQSIFGMNKPIGLACKCTISGEVTTSINCLFSPGQHWMITGKL